jgi:GT2 family glycosyltransferase
MLPHVCVIIPTHNRRDVLLANLEALSEQSYPKDCMEVVVVADGCTDGTEKMIEPRYPFALRVLSQPPSGAGAARNRGATAAVGDLLVFLDDDVIPTPGLIDAHVAAHRASSTAGVVIGPSLMPPEAVPTFFGQALRQWWLESFEAMSKPRYSFSHRDLMGGNFSLPAELFRSVGGFDVTFRHAREDGELGARLLCSGAPFAYAPDALAEHQETADLAHCVRRWRHEGRADVHLGRRHPQIRKDLPLARRSPRAVRLVYQRPYLGRIVATGSLLALGLLERLGMKRHWSSRFGLVYQYWYWRGVADELRTVQALTLFREPSANVDAAGVDRSTLQPDPASGGAPTHPSR